MKNKKRISILGSTGSIGTQTLDVALSSNRREGMAIEVAALTANRNTALLKEQVLKFHPPVAVVTDEEAAFRLSRELKEISDTQVLTGMDGLIAAATLPGVDTVVNALVGSRGLKPTLKAIEAGKNIALANKETLVAAGALVTKLVREKGVQLYPIDSEHSAIFQCLAGNRSEKIHTLYLTASGGPFRLHTPEMLQKVTLQDALKHPNWVMGKKITIDSATLMNKGLEVIEARWLFDTAPEQIRVLVHPQSVIHSMVEYEDGAVLAQLGEADMRVPIAYALTYPHRIKNDYPRLDFFARNSLTFEPPRMEDFPCLGYAYDALAAGGTMPAVLNAANEAAVALFLSEKIAFTDIPRLIKRAMSAYTVSYDYTLEDILAAEAFAKSVVQSAVQ